MRINGPGVLIQQQNLSPEILHQLKDGQKIVAKIISVTNTDVLLQAGGDQIRAKAEGDLPAVGSVFIFGVRMAEQQRIELKPLANLSEGRMMDGFFPEDHVLANVLKEQGLPVTKDNLDTLSRLLSDLHLKSQITPDLKVAAFMVARGLPPSVGAYLIAWLHLDKKLKENLWNKLDEMGLVNKSAVFQLEQDPEELMKALLRFWKESQSSPETNGFAKAAGLLRNNGRMITDLQPEAEAMIEEFDQEAKERWKNIADLLSHPATWSEKNPSGDNASPIGYGAFPFLVRMAGDKIRECVIHWEEKRETVKSMPEQTVRVVVPTENLGEIELTVTLFARRPPYIRFQVESDEIRQLLTEQMAALRRMTGPLVRIEIETVMAEAGLPEGVDVWM